MNEQFLDYLLEVLYILIWGILFLNAFYFLRRYLRRKGSRWSFLFIVLVVGCLGQGEEPARITQPPPTTTPAPVVQIYNDTPQGLEAALASGRPVVVEFNASWCYNCLEQSSIIHELEGERPDVIFISLDSDIFSDTADDYEVEYLPTLMVFDAEGERVKTFIGLTEKSKLEEILDSL